MPNKENLILPRAPGLQYFCMPETVWNGFYIKWQFITDRKPGKLYPPLQNNINYMAG